MSDDALVATDGVDVAPPDRPGQREVDEQPDGEREDDDPVNRADLPHPQVAQQGTGELADAHAAYRWFKACEDVGTLILVGHSVGTLLSLEIADREPDVDGAILLGVTTKMGEEILAWQTRQIGDNLVPRPIKALLRLFRTSVEKQQQKAVAKIKETTTDTARVQLAKVNAKWMREFFDYDPLPTLGRVQLPLLAMTGSKDVQVDPADLAVVSATAARSEVLEVPDVDHILREKTGLFSNPRHYGNQASKPIDPRVTDRILGWLDQRWPASSV